MAPSPDDAGEAVPGGEGRSRPTLAAAAALTLVALAWAPAAGPARAREWRVAGGDEARLAEVLRLAGPGDRVIVDGGRHRGPLTIDRPVSLVGRGWPVIEGPGRGTVISVRAPGTTISGFVIRGSGSSLDEENSGLTLDESPDGRIAGNRFEDVLFGIYLRKSSRSEIVDNVITSKRLDRAAPRRRDTRLVQRRRAHRGQPRQRQPRRGAVVLGTADGAGQHGRGRPLRPALHVLRRRRDRGQPAARQLGRRLPDVLAAAAAAAQHDQRQPRAERLRRRPQGHGRRRDHRQPVRRQPHRRLSRQQPARVGEPHRAVGQPASPATTSASRSCPTCGAAAFSATASSTTSSRWRSPAAAPTPRRTSGGATSGAPTPATTATATASATCPSRPTCCSRTCRTGVPALKLFLYSPAKEALEVAARTLPLIRPRPKVVDSTPRMTPAEPDGCPPLAAGTGLGFRGLGLSLLLLAAVLVAAPAAAERKVGAVADGAAPARRAAEAQGGPAPILQAVGVSKSFGETVALDEVTFDVVPGESVAVWGPNGAGKTTLLRLLLGVVPFDGEVRVAGVDPRRHGRAARAAIGFVPQEIALQRDLEVGETLQLFARLRRAPAGRIAAVLARLGLELQQEQAGGRAVRRPAAAPGAGAGAALRAADPAARRAHRQPRRPRPGRLHRLAGRAQAGRPDPAVLVPPAGRGAVAGRPGAVPRCRAPGGRRTAGARCCGTAAGGRSCGCASGPGGSRRPPRPSPRRASRRAGWATTWWSR